MHIATYMYIAPTFWSNYHFVLQVGLEAVCKIWWKISRKNNLIAKLIDVRRRQEKVIQMSSETSYNIVFHRFIIEFKYSVAKAI